MVPSRETQTYRCISCGVRWPRHYPSCPRCWETGCLVPWADRPRAALDSEPAVSTARAMAEMAWRGVIQTAYPALELKHGALVVVAGLPGSGKSSFAGRLANSSPGPALYVAAEEGVSPSLGARLLRCGIRREDFHVISRANVDQAVAHARKVGARSMVIDSAQEACWSAHDLRHVITIVRSLSFLVAVSQVTKDGLPAGSNSIQHEADVLIRVEEMRWRIAGKSRYQDATGVSGGVLPPMTKDGENE